MALSAALKATQPAELTITVNQGATFYQEFQILDSGVAVDISGYTATSKIKTDFGSSAITIATFACTIPTGTDGIIRIRLSPTTTTSLPETGFTSDAEREKQLWYWDLELTDGTDTVRLVEGPVVFSREVTS